MGAAAAAAVNEVFVDASYWIALRAPKDPGHEQALELASRLARERRRLVTTHLAFAEIHAFFVRSRKARTQVINDFTSGSVARLQPVEQEDYQAAFELLKTCDDKTYSFCDAVSFVFMRRLGIRQALSFDQHFYQIGEFEIL
jgi:uncharacterized protein